MAETEIFERVPIATDKDGVIRVSGTRIPIETVIGAFRDGATAEEIVQDFSSLPLSDVYQVIAYYLRHKDELQAYFDRQDQEAEEVRKVIEAQWPPDGIRARLLARQQRI